MLVTAANMVGLEGVAHGFFTRNGGVSGGIYASLNCGMGAKGDVAGNIAENRRRVAQALGVRPSHLLSLSQVHGAEVVSVHEIWQTHERPEADALVTAVPAIALGILTADCVPVLFADTHNRVIGAAHAGWKGAFRGVLQQTVEAMEALGANRDTITAAIGPAIEQVSYEVGEDFREAFISHSGKYMKYFAVSSDRPGHWLFDLKKFVHDILVNAGIKNINVLNHNTYLEEERFFSYRRATHRSEPDYGRQVSAIALMEN